MKAAFAGNINESQKYLNLIKNHIFGGPDIRLCGVMCENTKDTATLAIELNTKAYLSVSSLAKEADIIFICFSGRTLSAFTNKLKSMRIRDKILCRFETGNILTPLSVGVTNTCYCISMPYPADFSEEEPDYVPPLVFEGGGKQHETFCQLIRSVYPKALFRDKTSVDLSHFASRIITQYMRVLTDFSKKLYISAGLYDEEAFGDFVVRTAKKTAVQNDKMNTELLSAANHTSNRKLMEKAVHGEFVGIYREMEMHILKSENYSEEEKELILRTLKKSIRKSP